MAGAVMASMAAKDKITGISHCEVLSATVIRNGGSAPVFIRLCAPVNWSVFRKRTLLVSAGIGKYVTPASRRRETSGGYAGIFARAECRCVLSDNGTVSINYEAQPVVCNSAELQSRLPGPTALSRRIEAAQEALSDITVISISVKRFLGSVDCISRSTERMLSCLDLPTKTSRL